MDDIVMWLKEHAGLVGALVAGFLLAFLLIKRQTPGKNDASTAGLTGLQKDASGNGIVYRDVSDRFVNVDSHDTYNAMPVEHPYEPSGIIRPAETSNGPTYQFDKEHSQGVPIRASTDPTAQIIGWLPFGSTVKLNGQAVTGQNNILGASTGVGSNLWYPVSGGYISSFDLSSIGGQN